MVLRTDFEPIIGHQGSAVQGWLQPDHLWPHPDRPTIPIAGQVM